MKRHISGATAATAVIQRTSEIALRCATQNTTAADEVVVTTAALAFTSIHFDTYQKYEALAIGGHLNL